MKNAIMGIAMTLAVVANAAAQSKKVVDISTLADAGSVSAGGYTNSFFKLTVHAANATFQLNPLVNTAGERARLLQVLAKPAKWRDTYTFAVLADSRIKYPQLQSPAHYVRSVRHQLEKDGLPTVREEFSITIGGVQFTGAILQEAVPDGSKYYRGIYATFRDGYVLSFDAEATSADKLSELVTRIVTFMK